MHTITPCLKDDIPTIINGINTYNLQQVAALAPMYTPLEFVAKDTNNTIIGGILGGIGYYNGLEIKTVWVAPHARTKGLGSQLLKHIENVAHQKGATIAMLDTFDFQAKDFYLKNGYTIVGTIDNFPKGHQRFYLSKQL